MSNDPFTQGRELISFDVIAKWLKDVEEGRWVWTRNSRCKYVAIHFDTRVGAFFVKDRDGIKIDAETLLYQYEGEG